MKVLIDTCVWSRVLRHRKPDPRLTAIVTDLISDSRAVLIGPIRQEILSGVPDPKQFDTLKRLLSAYDDVPLHSHHFETAAEFCNTCRSHGLQGSTIDFLICSVAHLEHLLILTLDKDFTYFARFLPIELYE